MDPYRSFIIIPNVLKCKMIHDICNYGEYMEKLNYSLAQRFSQWLLAEKNDSELKRYKITYSVQLILNDGEKIVLIGLFFSFLGRLTPYIMCVLFLGMLRTYCGGIHLNTFWNCFFMSFTCFGAIIFLGQYLLISSWQSYVIYLIDFILLLVFAPLPSKKRFIYSEKQKYLAKFYSCIVLAIVICIGIFTKSLSNYITWIIVVQIIEIAGKLIYLKMEGSETE